MSFIAVKIVRLSIYQSKRVDYFFQPILVDKDSVLCTILFKTAVTQELIQVIVIVVYLPLTVWKEVKKGR